MPIQATVFKGSASGDIVQSTTTLETPTGTKVLVRITHAGICGTDEHYKNADMVLGHEGVGTVEQVGPNVTQLKVGDVVGWGFLNNTCKHCEQCVKGQGNYCRGAEVEMYGFHNFHQGAWGSHAVWDESWLFKVPEGMSPAHAAPLMCGGATVFQIIEEFDIRPTNRVGIVGMGGLGSMAIQFLSKMGCDVVVFSSTDAKKAEAMKLGATEFVATKGVEKFEGVGALEVLLVTTSDLADWNMYLGILKPKARIFPLTINNSNFTIPVMPFITGGIQIQGSVISSRPAHVRMLDFAARNKIEPVIETFKLDHDGVVTGMKKLRDGKMRYRGVLIA